MKHEDIIAEMITSSIGEKPEVYGFNLHYKGRNDYTIEYLGKARQERKKNSGEFDSILKCGLEVIHSHDYGKDYDCDYEFAGEIDCDECAINGGDYDPRYSRESQEIKTIATNKGRPENTERIIVGMERDITELKRKMGVIENQLTVTIDLCNDIVKNLELLWSK